MTKVLSSLRNCKFAHAIDVKRRHNANDQGYAAPFGTREFASVMDVKRQHNANGHGYTTPF